MNIIAYTSKKLADKELADYIFSKINEISVVEKNIIIAVSGGSTPFEMYKLLAKKIATLNQTIHIIQVDERFVSRKSERSNQQQLSEIFQENCKFYPMTTPDDTDNLENAVEQTSTNYEQLLNDLNKKAPDLTLLGMGTDGHTASLFPNNERYVESLNQNHKVIGMYVDSQGEERISLSDQLINMSKYKILYAHGSEKLQTLKEAVNSQNKEMYPILSVIDKLKLFTVKEKSLWEFSEEWKIESLN